MKRILVLLLVVLAGLGMNSESLGEARGDVPATTETAEEFNMGTPTMSDIEKEMSEELQKQESDGPMYDIRDVNNIYDKYMATIDSDDTVIAVNTCLKIVSDLQSVHKNENVQTDLYEEGIDNYLWAAQGMLYDFGVDKTVFDGYIEWKCDFDDGIQLTLKLATENPDPETGLYDCTATVEWLMGDEDYLQLSFETIIQ